MRDSGDCPGREAYGGRPSRGVGARREASPLDRLLAANPLGAVRRRDALKVLAAIMAEWWLPRRLFAQRPAPSSPLSARPDRPARTDRKVIVVTFGGGVRYEDSLAPSGWVNIPHLAKELVPQGLVYPSARYDGITGHFNSTGALVTGASLP